MFSAFVIHTIRMLFEYAEIGLYIDTLALLVLYMYIFGIYIRHLHVSIYIRAQLLPFCLIDRAFVKKPRNTLCRKYSKYLPLASVSSFCFSASMYVRCNHHMQRLCYSQDEFTSSLLSKASEKSLFSVSVEEVLVRSYMLRLVALVPRLDPKDAVKPRTLA